MERRAASAGAIVATLAGGFALRKLQPPRRPRSTTMSAASAARGASQNRLFLDAGGVGVTGSAGFFGFGFAGTPTSSE